MSTIKSLDKWFNNLSLRGRIIVTIIFFIFAIPISAALIKNISNYFGANTTQDSANDIPREQQELLGIFSASYREYAEKKGNYALQKLVEEKQAQKLCSYFETNNSFVGWHGRVSEINPSLGDNFTLRINMYFDNVKYNTLYFDHRNIEKNSQLYKSLLSFGPGDLIIFSGKVRVTPTELESAADKVIDAMDAVNVARGNSPARSPKCSTFRQTSNSLERPIIEFTFTDIKPLKKQQ